MIERGALEVRPHLPLRLYQILPNGERREIPFDVGESVRIEREGAIARAYLQALAVYDPPAAARAAVCSIEGLVPEALEEALRAIERLVR